jgi:hypothetical protein
MTMRRLIGLLAAVLLLLPGIASAQAITSSWDTEVLATDFASAACADTYTALIHKPREAKGIFIWTEVLTAGGALLIDTHLEMYSPTLDSYLLIDNNCEGAGGITTTGSYICMYSVDGSATTWLAPALYDHKAPLPTFFRLQTDCGNAETVSFQVYYQWMWY